MPPGLACPDWAQLFLPVQMLQHSNHLPPLNLMARQHQLFFPPQLRRYLRHMNRPVADPVVISPRFAGLKEPGLHYVFGIPGGPATR